MEDFKVYITVEYTVYSSITILKIDKILNFKPH